MLRRSRARLFGILALAAIALQMVLSLGHTHAGTGQFSGFEAASVNCIDDTGTSCPAPSHHGNGNAGCSICLAAHQTAAAVPPSSPEIAPPDRMATALKPFVSAPVRAATKTASFYARGPPAA